VAFAGWMAATYIVNDSHRFVVSALTFIMALLVAQTRVESGVHSALEVAYGGALGAFVTLAVFQLL
jgi:diacylglycerol kinase (ATP)